MNKKVVDVAVIGAGPVGMYTGYYCGLRKLETLLFDSLEIMGGQISNLYAEKTIEDLPGLPNIRAQSFVDALSDQLAQVASLVTPMLATNIIAIEKQDDETFAIRSETNTWFAKAIIITVGNGAFLPRLLGIESESEFHNIHYFIKQLDTFKDRHVVLFGGGDSAVDWSLMLEPLAASVSIVHRRDEFRAKQANVEKLLNSKVNIYTPYVAKEIAQHQDYHIKTIRIQDVKTNETIDLPVDNIVVNYGVVSDLGFIKKWDAIELNKHKIIARPTGETSIPGVFACGDVVQYPGRESQIVTGLAEGLMASAAAARYINPDKKIRPIR